MSRPQAEQSVLHGFKLASDLFAAGTQLLGTGDMGIGNTTPSAALGVALTGMSVNLMVGRGTGIDEEALKRKCEIVRQAVEINRPNPGDGLDALAKVGGFEIGGIAGCVLAGAYHRRPVVIDGFISTAGALVAHSLCPAAIDYVFAGHCSEEAGHRRMLEHLGLEPILDLRMRLGEGTGAALAMGVIEGAVKVFKEVLTFEDAGSYEQVRVDNRSLIICSRYEFARVCLPDFAASPARVLEQPFMWRQFTIALSFLTIFRLPVSGEISPHDSGRCYAAFPVVGLLVGLHDFSDGPGAPGRHASSSPCRLGMCLHDVDYTRVPS